MTILCCGLLTLDVVQRVSQVPGPNQKVAALSADLNFGGPAANAAAVAQALGSQVRLLSYLGSGHSGQLVGSLVEATGVVFTRLESDGDDSPQVPVSTVLVTESTAERAVVSSHALVADDLQLPLGDLWDGIQVLLLDGHYLETACRLAQQAHDRSIPVVLDGGSWKPGLERLLPLVDIAILSADFQGDTSACPVVARSHGADPIELGDQWIVVPTPDHIVDTLGAGDVLHGAFVHYLTQGHAIKDSLRKAAHVATYSCQYEGARGWVDSWASPAKGRSTGLITGVMSS